MFLHPPCWLLFHLLPISSPTPSSLAAVSTVYRLRHSINQPACSNSWKTPRRPIFPPAPFRGPWNLTNLEFAMISDTELAFLIPIKKKNVWMKCHYTDPWELLSQALAGKRPCFHSFPPRSFSWLLSPASISMVGFYDWQHHCQCWYYH